jgi:hypothetical protein
MSKQVKLPAEVKEILRAEQRKVRSTLINYDGPEPAPEEDMEVPESDAVTAKQVEGGAPKKRGRPRKDATTESPVKRVVEVEVEDTDADADVDTETRSKRFLTEIERQAGGDKEKIRELLTKRFVPLVDVLPPLPTKGGFDIELIKQSPYFFS